MVINCLYLSGGMTGIPEKNYWAFRDNTALLRETGYAVVNPWELDQENKKNTWEECLRRDIIEMMGKCEGVATLPGWKKSKGAKLEVAIAKGLGWPVHTVAYWRRHATFNGH